MSKETRKKKDVKHVPSDIALNVETQAPENPGVQDIASLLRDSFERITESAERGNRVTGISTGYERLDNATGGLHPGELVLIASRPGMGKSSLALQIGINVASPIAITDPSPNENTISAERHVPGYGVLVFSLEMAPKHISVRAMCSEGRVNIGQLRQGRLLSDDWRRLTEAASYLASLPIWFDRVYDVADIRSKVQKMQVEFNRPATGTTANRKIGLVIVDPVQLLESYPRRQNREEEIADATRALRRMALDLDVAVIATSQLNRSAETRVGRDKRPILTDLRESGALEDAADAVLFVYRDEYYNPESTFLEGIAEIIIAKQRCGATCKILTRFASSCGRFDNLAAGDYPNFDED